MDAMARGFTGFFHPTVEA